jgi:serine/threonine protein kinase
VCYIIFIQKDVKPANVLIHNGQIKLGDFGAAKLRYKSSSKIKKQHEYNMAGTPCYLAPELITEKDAGSNVSFASFAKTKGEQDIWSAGCLLYEMILGREPWDQIDNVYSLYYTIGGWSLSARKKESDLRDPIARRDSDHFGCDFESDVESAFSVSDDESSQEKAPPQYIGVSCVLNNSGGFSHPLLSVAVASKLFPEDALDFLRLTLQGNVSFVPFLTFCSLKIGRELVIF